MRATVRWVVAAVIAVAVFGGEAVALALPPTPALPQVAPLPSTHHPTVRHSTPSGSSRSSVSSTPLRRSSSQDVSRTTVNSAKINSQLDRVKRNLIASNTLTQNAQRDVVLARYCLQYGKPYHWSCYHIDPHRLEGSIARMSPSSGHVSDLARSRAWQYIVSVERKHLFNATRERLDAIIDQAIRPAKKTWSTSVKLRSVKARVERLGDLGKTSYLPAFFRTENIGRLRVLAQSLGVQRPPVAAAINGLFSEYNKTCAYKSVPKWPTVCALSDASGHPLVKLRQGVLANLPLAVPESRTDKSVALHFARHRVPQLFYVTWRTWQLHTLGNLKKPSKKLQQFVKRTGTAKPAKDDKIPQRARMKQAWLNVPAAFKLPACVRSSGVAATAKSLENCFTAQRQAYWAGFNKLGSVESAKAAISQGRSMTVVFVLAVVLLLCVVGFRRLVRRSPRHLERPPS